MATDVLIHPVTRSRLRRRAGRTETDKQGPASGTISRAFFTEPKAVVMEV